MAVQVRTTKDISTKKCIFCLKIGLKSILCVASELFVQVISILDGSLNARVVFDERHVVYPNEGTLRPIHDGYKVSVISTDFSPDHLQR